MAEKRAHLERLSPSASATSMIGKTAASAALALADSSIEPAISIAIARGQLGDDRLQLRAAPPSRPAAAAALVDVAAHGDRRHAIAASQDRVLHPHLDMADLLERDHAPVARVSVMSSSWAGRAGLRQHCGRRHRPCGYPRAPGSPTHPSAGTAIVRAASAGDSPISRRRSWSRTKCDGWHALAPVGVHLTHAGIGAHHRANLLGDAAQNLRVRPRHAERDREGRVRAEDQLRDPHPRLRRETLGNLLR